LFMGQEFGSTRLFNFFAEHENGLSAVVWNGRRKFLAQFPDYAKAPKQARVPDPSRRSAFEASKLDFSERRKHAALYRFHRELIALRKSDPVIAAQSRERLDGAVLGEDTFLLRYYGAGGDDRLLLVHLGSDFFLEALSEPLLAPPAHRRWKMIWSSEEKRYGGRAEAAFIPSKRRRLKNPVAQFYRPYAE